MDKKYLIILLFIFLVFLMGSINSTITNSYYNNTTGTQDHSNLSNLSYANSNHTGFQSSDTLDDDVSALGYVTNATVAHDDEKVNKTGDTMTGSLKIYLPTNTSLYPSLTNSTSGGQRINDISSGMEVYNINDTQNNFITYRSISKVVGIGYPYLFMSRIYANFSNSTITDMDYIPDATTIGLISFQGSLMGSSGLSGTKARLQVLTDGAWNDSDQPTQIRIWNDNGKGITIRQDDSVTMAGLAGTGNDYSCLDSTGKFYRDPTGCS